MTEEKRFEHIKWLHEEHHSKNEMPFVMEYLRALRVKDEEVIEKYQSFALQEERYDTPRHIIVNAHHHHAFMQYGYTEIVLNDYGWIEHNGRWVIEEEISLRTKKDKAIYNRVQLAQGLNGMWAWGVCYNCGGSGGGSSPNEYKEPIADKKEAIKAGLEYILERMNYGFKAAPNDSCGNYNVPIMKDVVKLINLRALEHGITLDVAHNEEKELPVEGQLQLF